MFVEQTKEVTNLPWDEFSYLQECWEVPILTMLLIIIFKHTLECVKPLSSAELILAVFIGQDSDHSCSSR